MQLTTHEATKKHQRSALMSENTFTINQREVQNSPSIRFTSVKKFGETRSNTFDSKRLLNHATRVVTWLLLSIAVWDPDSCLCYIFHKGETVYYRKRYMFCRPSLDPHSGTSSDVFSIQYHTGVKLGKPRHPV